MPTEGAQVRGSLTSGVSFPPEVGEELLRRSSGRVLFHWDLGSAIGPRRLPHLDRSSVSSRHFVDTVPPDGTGYEIILISATGHKVPNNETHC